MKGGDWFKGVKGYGGRDEGKWAREGGALGGKKGEEREIQGGACGGGGWGCHISTRLIEL